MVTINSDDPAMARALRAHAALSLEQGGSIAPGVVIRSAGGEISVAHPAPPPPDVPLITIPDASLVRIEDDTLCLQGDEIGPGRGFSTLSADRQRILAAQCDVYNLGRKISKTRARVPKLAYQDAPELLGALLFRRLPNYIEPDKTLVTPPILEPPDVLSAFVDSRLLAWREPDTPSETTRVLMSLIDYFDHHHDGARYDALTSPALLSVSTAQCGAPTDACFINYHAGDPHAMFIHHGFVDTSTFFTRSARFELDLPGIGLLRVKPGRPRRGHASRGESDAEYGFPTPVVQSADADTIEVSNLVIKMNDGRSTLRRGLAIALLVVGV